MKKYLIPTAAVFVVLLVFNYIFHNIVMKDFYLEMSQIFRPQDEIQKNHMMMYVANLIFAFAFCYIYSKGHEKKAGIIQGLRYGIWISLLVWLPQTIINVSLFPFPKTLEMYWLSGYVIQSLIAGLTVAAVYKD